MDDILLEPMFPGLTLNSASKESLVALTLTDALTIDTGTIVEIAASVMTVVASILLMFVKDPKKEK